MRPISCAGTVALSAALLVISAWAAQAGEPAALLPSSPPIDVHTPLDDVSAAPEVHLNLIDQKLALSLAVDTQWQIEMGEFAQGSIVSDALGRFVTIRLESHRDFAAELNALTKGRAASALARARREIDKDRVPEKVSKKKKFRLLSVRSATAMLARIRVEILQEYAAMQRDELAAKSAEEFDLVYLQFDLLNQMQVLATLKVFEHQASADFAEVIHRAWARTYEQFEIANQLLLQLDAAPLAGVAPLQPDLVEIVAEP